MAGRWKTLLVWGLIAVAALTCLAGFDLPVVDATEEGAVVVSDQLPPLANDTNSTNTDGTSTQDPTAGSDPAANSGTALPSGAETTVSEDPALSSTSPTGTEPDAAVPLVEPLVLTPEEELANYMSSRVGLVVPYDPSNFPATNVDVTGEFVFTTPLINGTQFSATQSRGIPEDQENPTVFSAFTTYGNGTMNGFDLYKNMNFAPYYDDCYIVISGDGPVSFSNLAMEVTELCAQELIGVRTFPIFNFWTTKPGADLPLADGEVPTTDPFRGTEYKTTVIKMTADSIQIPNFHLSMRPGTI